jgi:hypothetical protein
MASWRTALDSLFRAGSQRQTLQLWIKVRLELLSRDNIEGFCAYSKQFLLENLNLAQISLEG